MAERTALHAVFVIEREGRKRKHDVATAQLDKEIGEKRQKLVQDYEQEQQDQSQSEIARDQALSTLLTKQADLQRQVQALLITEG